MKYFDKPRSGNHETLEKKKHPLTLPTILGKWSFKTCSDKSALEAHVVVIQY